MIESTMFLQDMLFILIWLGLPLLWHTLLKTAGLSLLRPTLPSFVIAALYVYQYIGIPFLYFKVFPDRVAYGVNDQILIMTVWAYTSVTITLMLVGYHVARSQYGVLLGFSGQFVRAGCLTQQQIMSLAVLGLVSCFVLYLYLWQVGFQNIALLVALDLGAHIDPKAARSDMGNSFAGNYHWYRLFMRDVLTFVWLALFAQYLIRPRKVVLMMLLGFGSALLFSLIMATEKGPVANFLLSVLLVTVWVRYQGFLTLRLILVFGFLLAIILVLAYIFFMGSSNWVDALYSVASRAFTGQIQPAYHYLEFFPEHQYWLWGVSFPNPGGLLPFEPYLLTQEVANWKNPEHVAMGIHGSMPTVYWGEMYANFGVIGILAFSMPVGYLLYMGNRIIFMQRHTPITVAFFVWLLMHYKVLATSGLSGFIIDIELVIFLMIFMVLHKLRIASDIHVRKTQDATKY